ncbi:MAG: hypothetical protein MUC93_12420 [Bacteroidales bacterium]|jgi:hypothetical protein|nr:hypothetical protein [Bacteroidales bacterium]
MKNAGKITGMLLLLFVAVNLSLSAQRGMRGMRPDSVKMERMPQCMTPMQMNNMNQFMCPMFPMGRHAACGMMQPAMNMRHMGPGMGRKAMVMRHRGMGNLQAAPRMRVMENIPNLTDKQKKDIADLRQQQKGEMQKFREGMQTKMKDLRESHKTKMMGLLTDEQKKWLEEQTPEPINK